MAPASAVPKTVPARKALRLRKGYTKARVRQMVAHWVPKLRLGDWQIQVVFDPSLPHRATCEASPEYKEATLTFNLPACSEREEDLEGCVVHELCHCHTWAQAAETEALCRTPADWKRSNHAEEAATTELTLLALSLAPRLFKSP